MTEIKALEQRIDKRFDDLTALMSGFANAVNDRFDQHDARFDRIEVRLNQHDARFDRIEADHEKHTEQYSHLVNTIDGFIKRIDDYETELAARDHKVDRLERWIQQIAKQTGVELSA